MKTLTFVTLSSAVLFELVISNAAVAVPFPTLDPGYSQEYYTGDISGLGWGPGYAWTNNGTGNLLLRGNNQIWEYSATANTTYNGDAVHGYTVHAIAGDNTGYGMTNGLDGFLYAVSSAGLERIDTTTWTATVLPGTVGGYYGIDTMADGRIAYSDTASIYAYNTVTNTNTWLYTAGGFIDGIAATATGEIFLAVLGSTMVDVINSAGTLVNQFSVSHGPDGMAFGGGNAYVNNTDGTVTKLIFAGSNYTGAVTEVTLASGGYYGDLASSGPDCSFYVSQWGTTNQIVRLSKNDGSCGFNDGGDTSLPEPGSLPLLVLGVACLGLGRKMRLKTL